MSKKKENREEKELNKWMPIGTMIGSVVGLIISLEFNNFIYFGCCVVCGLMLGVIIGSVTSEEDNDVKESKKKK